MNMNQEQNYKNYFKPNKGHREDLKHPKQTKKINQWRKLEHGERNGQEK